MHGRARACNESIGRGLFAQILRDAELTREELQEKS
jgi:hypothetical protein